MSVTVDFDEIRATVESLQVVLEPRRRREFTASEAARVWRLSIRAAETRLDKLLTEGCVTMRKGRSDTHNRPVNFYLKVRRKSKRP